jgi:hypothetical protein
MNERFRANEVCDYCKEIVTLENFFFDYKPRRGRPSKEIVDKNKRLEYLRQQKKREAEEEEIEAAQHIQKGKK